MVCSRKLHMSYVPSTVKKTIPAIFLAPQHMLTLSYITKITLMNATKTLQTSDVVLKALAAAEASRTG